MTTEVSWEIYWQRHICGQPAGSDVWKLTEAGFVGVTVTLEGAGRGAVSSDPPGIECGDDCFQSFLHGATLTLSASNKANSAFRGWAGLCDGTEPSCTVTVERDTGVSATFEIKFPPGELEIMVHGDGTGFVTSSPASIDCPATCSGNFEQGSTVKLTAAPRSGSEFVGWSGCDEPQGDSCEVLLDDDYRLVHATFRKK